VDAGSILGVPPLRPSFLDDLSAARPAEAEARGARGMNDHEPKHDYSKDSPTRFADDGDDELDDDLEDDFDDDDDDEEDDEEEDEPEDPETWQVSGANFG
jgi:hypothetical protein